MTAVPPRPAAPESTAGDGLRSALIEFLREHNPLYYEDAVDELMAGPLRDVLAAAARDAEKVRRVEALADEFSAGPDMQGQLYDGAYVADVFRAALDPS